MSDEQAIVTFKENFNINTDLTDVRFRTIDVEPYQPLNQDRIFGEKLCLHYNVELTILNIDIVLRILSFAYDTYAEVLKLDIQVHNGLLEKEITPCRNFLQRKRSLNLMFDTLVRFARLFEMRRLICQTVFQKQPNVTVSTDDNGVTIKCCNHDFSVKYLQIVWTISWQVVDCEIHDFLEFYCNYSVLQQTCGQRVRDTLETLVHLDDFQSKLKLWKLLIQDLYGCSGYIQTKNQLMVETSDVWEISDSESDESVIEINKICQEPIKDNILVIE